MRKFFFLLLFLMLANCISTQSKFNREKRRPFNPVEYQYIKLRGTATIKGQVLIPTRDGKTRPCSGCEITLNPATSYSEEFYLKTVQNGIPIEEPDLRVLKYIKKAIADDSGRFEFKNIAKGKYYLYAPIVYEIPNPNGGFTKFTGYVYKTVRINEGQVAEIILTR